MPLYPYQCDDCGVEFEVLSFRPNSDDVVECVACHSQSVTRVFKSPAKVSSSMSTRTTNCRGDGPPCGASWCGRAPNQT